MIQVVDKVTVITRRGSVHLAEVVAVFPTGTFRWSTTWLWEEVAALYDEGITWIRGWHTPGSPEADALVAAHALSKQDPWANNFIEAR